MIGRMRGSNGGPAAAVPQWGRRSVIAAAGVGAAGLLTGCRVRLEDDAPRVPLLPTREPAPDQGLLLQALAECRALRAAATALGGARTGAPARLAVLHGRQVEVLEQVLRDARVPARSYAVTPPASASPAPSVAGSAGSATATRTPPAGTPPAPGRAGLATQEGLAVQPGALTALAGVSTAHLSLLSALTVQRAVAVGLLGGAVRWPSTPVVPAAAAARLLPPARAAVYGFEVVAAQSAGTARARAVGVLATLRARTDQLEAMGGSEVRPPLGYDLPFTVTTPAAAARLARVLLPQLLLSLGSAYTAGAGDRPGLTGLLRWAAQTQDQALAWGVAPTAFPGLASR
jgi:hypothetical protein